LLTVYSQYGCLFRSQTLYPTELAALIKLCICILSLIAKKVN
jgi:hypothetical protein